MRIDDLKSIISNNFDEFSSIINDKLNINGLSIEMIEVLDGFLFVNIEDDSECVEYITVSLSKEHNYIECNMNGVSFFVHHFYDSMD